MKIAVLLSGGVDSSVALVRLKTLYPEAKITACYLKIWLEDELDFLGECPWEEDLAFARSLCELTGIPLKVISLQREYWDKVVSYAIAELKAGRTPNPDIFCNQRIKFGAFLERLGESPDKVASGHYAVVEQYPDGLYRIKRSPDPVKDQTYFLSHLSQQQAALVMFPIGLMRKNEVRRLARQWNLPNKDRKDSQGICFLGKIKYSDFVRYHLGEKEGRIIEAGSGCILGKHKGSWFHTIGQRSGLGLSGGPWYVVDKNMEENLVIVAKTPRAMEVATDCFVAVKPNWIADAPRMPLKLSMKLRHGPNIIGGYLAHESEISERLAVRMDEPDRGVAPGQFAVFYDEDICLGAAMIATI